jgi:hypothetical protein
VLSERHACRIVDQPRGTQRYTAIVRADEDALTGAIIALASKYGRYDYRRITALLRTSGWQVGCDRVQRIWRRESTHRASPARLQNNRKYRSSSASSLEYRYSNVAPKRQLRIPLQLQPKLVDHAYSNLKDRA